MPNRLGRIRGAKRRFAFEKELLEEWGTIMRFGGGGTGKIPCRQCDAQQQDCAS
jgi:hypothetical protein